jgi:hypothetical protein
LGESLKGENRMALRSIKRGLATSGIALAASVLTASSWSSTAHADTVFSNLGPGGSFDEFSGWSLGGPGAPPEQDVAGVFTTPAVAYTLDSAELALDRFGGSTNDTLTVQLWSDVAGAPGAVLQSTTITGITAVETLHAATFGGTFVLQPNTTYWLVADARTDFDGSWWNNATGDTGVATRDTDADAWGASAQVSPAFRINGTVPEPATGLALLAGAGLLLTRCRRRRSSAM